MKSPESSIVILTRNAGDKLKNTLDHIFSQKYKDFEVIIIDSASTDNTLDIAKKYPVRIKKIKVEEFGHGKTRSLGAKLSKGKYVIYITHDAVPKDNNWLYELINPLKKDKKIAGVYSRQVPKENEKAIERCFYLSLYPDKDKLWGWENFTQGDNIFSDVSSAIKRDILLKHPYSDKIIISEDYEWAIRILKEGYNIFYNSKSQVFHSHNYGLIKLFKRNFDIGVAYRSIYISKEKEGGFFKKGMKIMGNELKYLAKNKKAYLIPYALLKDATKFLGVTLGKHSNLLPNFLNKWFSNYPRYWRN
ncbi:MAG: glycosyltransferase family 2 protein [Nanobdellota archaeon]